MKNWDGIVSDQLDLMREGNGNEGQVCAEAQMCCENFKFKFPNAAAAEGEMDRGPSCLMAFCHLDICADEVIDICVTCNNRHVAHSHSR